MQNESMIYGYARVSTPAQDETGQVRQLKAAGCEKEKGVKFGRKPKLTAHQQNEARKRLAAGETTRSIARSYNVHQSTISRL